MAGIISKALVCTYMAEMALSSIVPLEGSHITDPCSKGFSISTHSLKKKIFSLELDPVLS
jgi:hypothetical protein